MIKDFPCLFLALNTYVYMPIKKMQAEGASYGWYVHRAARQLLQQFGHQKAAQAAKNLNVKREEPQREGGDEVAFTWEPNFTDFHISARVWSKRENHR